MLRKPAARMRVRAGGGTDADDREAACLRRLVTVSSVPAPGWGLRKDLGDESLLFQAQRAW